MKEEEGCCIGFSHCVCGIHASLCHSQANQPLGEMLWLTSIQTRQFKTFPFFFLFPSSIWWVVYCCLCRASTWDPLTTVFFTIQKRFSGLVVFSIYVCVLLGLVCIVLCVAE